jgi:N-acetylneuraminate synthase
MATAFDEISVDWCQDLGIEIMKLASSDINDWPLIEKIATTRLPLICSNGGSSDKDLDDLVLFCDHRNIPLAINHCVAQYPCEDENLNIAGLDRLRERYPTHVLGFSSHEYHNWWDSMLIAYAKGARTFERHIDIPYPNNDHEVSKYCSLPSQVVDWIQAWKRVQLLCGSKCRIIPIKEVEYLDNLVRGIYAKRDLKMGDELIDFQNIYYAIPLQKGQLSCREIQIINNRLIREVKQDQPIMIEDIDCNNPSLVAMIKQRGI